jgi:hypothetical protein
VVWIIRVAPTFKDEEHKYNLFSSSNKINNTYMAGSIIEKYCVGNCDG